MDKLPYKKKKINKDKLSLMDHTFPRFAPRIYVDFTSMCLFDFQVALYFVYLAIGAGIAALLRKSRMLPILSCTVACFFFL